MVTKLPIASYWSCEASRSSLMGGQGMASECKIETQAALTHCEMRHCLSPMSLVAHGVRVVMIRFCKGDVMWWGSADIQFTMLRVSGIFNGQKEFLLSTIYTKVLSSVSSTAAGDDTHEAGECRHFHNPILQRHL